MRSFVFLFTALLSFAALSFSQTFSPTELATLTGHKGDVRSLSFSPDENFLASAGNDNTVRIWKRTGDSFAQSQVLNGHTKHVCTVCFSPDGKYLASGSDDALIKIWKQQDGQFQAHQTLQSHTRYVMSLAFSPDGTLLFSGSHDESIKVWKFSDDKFSEQETLKYHSSNIENIAISTDGKTIAVASWNPKVGIWFYDGSSFIKTSLDVEGALNRSVGLSPDGRYIALGGDSRKIHVWKVGEKGMTELNVIIGHRKGVNSLSFSPDGKFLSSGSGDGTIKVFRTEGDPFPEVNTIQAHKDGVEYVLFSPKGTYLASGGSDDCIRIWKVGLDEKVALAPKTISQLIVQLIPPAGDQASAQPKDGTTAEKQTVEQTPAIKFGENIDLALTKKYYDVNAMKTFKLIARHGSVEYVSKDFSGMSWVFGIILPTGTDSVFVFSDQMDRNFSNNLVNSGSLPVEITHAVKANGNLPFTHYVPNVKIVSGLLQKYDLNSSMWEINENFTAKNIYNVPTDITAYALWDTVSIIVEESFVTVNKNLETRLSFIEFLNPNYVATAKARIAGITSGRAKFEFLRDARIKYNPSMDNKYKSSPPAMWPKGKVQYFEWRGVLTNEFSGTFVSWDPSSESGFAFKKPIMVFGEVSFKNSVRVIGKYEGTIQIKLVSGEVVTLPLLSDCYAQGGIW